MKNALLLIALLGYMNVGLAQHKSLILDVNAHQREKQVDFVQMDLELRFVPDSGLVKGTVTHHFVPLRFTVDSLFLDAIKMDFSKVSMGGAALTYKNTDEGITLFFESALKRDSSYAIEIEYTANPKRGLYFIGWDDPSERCRKQIWTQGQGIDNRHWIPMFDNMNDKIKTNIEVTTSSKFSVLSNGELLNKKVGDDANTTWNYAMTKPYSPYLIMLGIGMYDIYESTSKSGVSLKNYMYQEWPDRMEPTYRFSTDIFNYLEDEIGVPYPWGGYSQIPVQDFPYGAMENTSATIFGDFFCVDSVGFSDVNYVYVNGHELAHQWFGDLVTSKSAKHHWLHESFATYYHHLVTQKFLGDDEFSRMMRDNQNAALAGSQKDFKGVGHSQGGTHRHYLKGSYVLRMLRYVVGDEDYRRGMKYYLEKHQFQNVGTMDLVNAFSESTGHSIGWFIDQWVVQGGEPHFVVKQHYQKKKQQIRLVVDQIQDTTELVSTFRMPVNIEVFYKDGSNEKQQFWIENSEDTFYFPSSKKKEIDFILFDPNSEILKSIEFEKPYEWLASQAIKAPYMIDRYDAVVGLKKWGHLKKAEVLHAVLNSNDYHLVRGEAFSQLNYASDVQDDEIRRIILGDDAAMQKLVLSSVKTLKLELKEDYELLLDAKSYEVINLALIRLCRAFGAEANRYLEQTKEVYGVRGNNVRITWLNIQWQMNGDSTALNELIDMTSNSYEFFTRQSAMSIVKSNGYCNEQLVVNLIGGIQKSNWKLASGSGKLLSYFYHQDAYTKMIDQVLKNLEMPDEERERVQVYLSRKP